MLVVWLENPWNLLMKIRSFQSLFSSLFYFINELIKATEYSIFLSSSVMTKQTLTKQWSENGVLCLYFMYSRKIWSLSWRLPYTCLTEAKNFLKSCNLPFLLPFFYHKTSKLTNHKNQLFLIKWTKTLWNSHVELFNISM